MAEKIVVPDEERGKFFAALQALLLVEDGMRIGLGTGSTAYWFVVLLANRMKRENMNIVAVPTSQATADLATSLEIPLANLDELRRLDLTVDGADEVSPSLDLIKGGGGALLIEKIVANASDRMVVIADGGKKLPFLGEFPLPIEVVRTGWKTTMDNLSEIFTYSNVEGTRIDLRRKGAQPFVTDEGHFILDCKLGHIQDPDELAKRISQVPGVVEHGLFVGVADSAIFGYDDAEVEIFDREQGDLGRRELFFDASDKDSNFVIEVEI